MKCLLLADDRVDLLTMLEPILKHWGYRVLTAKNAVQANTFLQESTPDLLLIGASLLADPTLELPSQTPPQLVFAHPAAASSAYTLAVPVDIFELFRQVQAQIEYPPRQNLRLHLRLPGMYRQGKGQYVVAELLSLSMCGLFFRSPLRVTAGTQINAVFPLLGQGKELEVTGTVLYTVDPGPYNNYTQGFGLGFSELTAEEHEHLQNYIKERFLDQVTASANSLEAFIPSSSR